MRQYAWNPSGGGTPAPGSLRRLRPRPPLGPGPPGRPAGARRPRTVCTCLSPGGRTRRGSAIIVVLRRTRGPPRLSLPPSCIAGMPGLVGCPAGPPCRPGGDAPPPAGLPGLLGGPPSASSPPLLDDSFARLPSPRYITNSWPVPSANSAGRARPGPRCRASVLALHLRRGTARAVAAPPSAVRAPSPLQRSRHHSNARGRSHA